MDCCQAHGIEELFDPGTAQKDLRRYRKKGPGNTTRFLLNALKDEGVEGLTALDIGGGVGALQHGLLDSGAKQVTSIDASSSYLSAAKDEAKRQGHLERLQQHHGDFVELAEEAPEADIVTLDRVICCYDKMDELVHLSTERARRYYGVVYPIDNWLLKSFTWFGNLYFRIKGSQFRTFAHPKASIEAIIKDAGLERCFSRDTRLWHVHLYRRSVS